MTLIEKKFAAIEALAKTELFARQELFIKILRYLVTQEKEGKTPKSTTIALEVLHESQGLPTAQDSFIRSQIFSLRKKLELYYLTEGKEVKERLSIPKGTYKVKLTFLEKTKKKFTYTGKKIIYVGGVILLLSLIFNGITFKKLNDISTNARLPQIVHDIADDSKAVKVVISERTLYREYDNILNRSRFILDTKTEYPSDGNKMTYFIRDFPSRKIALTDLSSSSPETWRLGFDFLYKMKCLGITSELININKVNSIDEDILFLGHVGGGNMGFLKNYFELSSFRFSTSNKGIVTTALCSTSDTTFYSWQPVSTIKRKTYFIIVKCESIQKKKILFLVSSDVMSRDYMYNVMYNTSFDEQIKKQFGGKLPTQYEVMVEVEGKKLVGLKHKIIHAKEIN